MAWKKGPLPKSTYDWGGIVRKCDLTGSTSADGFEFASFCGDHAEVIGGKDHGTRVDACDVLLYDNGLERPSNELFKEISGL